MKRLAIVGAVAICLASLVPAASAQDESNEDKNRFNHGNLGVIFDFTRPKGTSLNMIGVGGRLGINITRRWVGEGELAYDFEQSTTRTFTAGAVTGTTRSNLRILHGLFGIKYQTTGNFRMFGLLKGGFANYGVGGPVTVGAINNQLAGIVDGDVKWAFYPGGGVEISRGKWGLRAEAGDEMVFFSDGIHHNLRLAAGPQIRF